jgi:hypothetical protein
MLFSDLPLQMKHMKGRQEMTGWKPCREPALDELLADDIMQKIIASSRIEPAVFRTQLSDMARRLGDRITTAPVCAAAAS